MNLFSYVTAYLRQIWPAGYVNRGILARPISWKWPGAIEQVGREFEVRALSYFGPFHSVMKAMAWQGALKLN